MPSKHVIQNICGSSSKYDLSKVSNSYTLNMYEETVDSSESYVNKILRPIPGMTTVCNIEGNCRGMYTVSIGYNGNPTTYAVFDDTLYLINNETNTPFEVGKIPYGSSKIHFCQTGNRKGYHTHLVFVDGTNCYAVDTQVLPALQVEDFSTIQLPLRDVENNVFITPSHIAYLYNYIVINDSETDAFYMSYQYPFEKGEPVDKNIFMYDSAEWGKIGHYTQADWQPDRCTALVSNGTRLFTFGPTSFQLFQYTNDVEVPFSSPDTAAQLIGLKAINSLCQIGNISIWLGSADIGNNGVYVNRGGVEVERVSTPAIEREIATFFTIEDAEAQIWQENQHIFYIINFPTANKTYCYDLAEQSWTNRASLKDDNTLVSWRYSNATMNGKGKIWHSAKDCIVEQTNDKWNEHDNNPILRLRRGGVIFSDYSNFFINDIQINTNNGQYGSEFYKDQVQMMMRFTADGSNWSDLEYCDIGYTGDYDYDCIFYDFGMAKCFTIELSCSDNVPFALYNIKINIDAVAY
jgi:hypothetical protein